jgi:hypothetical protein
MSNDPYVLAAKALRQWMVVNEQIKAEQQKREQLARRLTEVLGTTVQPGDILLEELDFSLRQA